MKISTKGRYALRVMIDLAEHNTGEYVPLKDIAKRQAISEKYLENILPVLTSNGYLAGLRGKGGGYKLTRPPAGYTVFSILSLVENSLAPVECLEQGKNDCERAAQCKTLPMWQKLNTLLRDFFEGITIADLCNPELGGDDYVI